MAQALELDEVNKLNIRGYFRGRGVRTKSNRSERWHQPAFILSMCPLVPLPHEPLPLALPSTRRGLPRPVQEHTERHEIDRDVVCPFKPETGLPAPVLGRERAQVDSEEDVGDEEIARLEQG